MSLKSKSSIVIISYRLFLSFRSKHSEIPVSEHKSVRTMILFIYLKLYSTKFRTIDELN